MGNAHMQDLVILIYMIAGSCYINLHDCMLYLRWWNQNSYIHSFRKMWAVVYWFCTQSFELY